MLEFIHLISSDANEICEQESKKTIAPEHIIGALKVCSHCAFCIRFISIKRLGFEQYVSEVDGVLKDHKQALKVCILHWQAIHCFLTPLQDREKKVSKWEQSGKTEEELLAEQERLFAASRMRFEASAQQPP